MLLKIFGSKRNEYSVPEPLICGKCGKTFGHQKILQLHLRIHNLSESSNKNSTDVVRTDAPECIDITESDTNEEPSSSSRNSEQESDGASSLRCTSNISEVSLRPSESSQTSSSSTGPTNLPQLPNNQSSHTVRAKRKIGEFHLGFINRYYHNDLATHQIVLK